jgi:hypothetical protein
MSIGDVGALALSGLIAFAACSSSSDECESMTCVSELPATVDATTVNSVLDELDHYGCDPSLDLSGREVVVRVTVPEDGFLEVARTGEGAPGTMLLLLGSYDALDCLDAHATNVGARVVAGDVFVVVDGPPGAESSVSLQMALTTAATFESAGINPELAKDALTVIQNAWAWGATRRSEYVVVDFTLHSAQPREWVFDLAKGELLWNLRVAHGRNSTNGTNLAMAVTFSNVNGSNKSSLGLMRSSGRYVGSFGESFRLEGLEPGFNDNACVRDIVMHPWAPVGDEYVNRCGWARPSLGCPAIDSVLAKPVRDRLARPDPTRLEAGVPMLFWYPNTDWQRNSVFLHGASSTPELTTAMSRMCDASQNNPSTPPASTDYACD